MSTYSTSLKLTLIGDGEQTGVWGQTTNTNLGTLLEQAITGVSSIVMTDANYTLSNLNGVSDEARNAVLVVTGTNAAIRDIIAPLVNKVYTVFNNTTGGYSIRIKGSTGIAVTIPNGVTTTVYCDGTNFYAGLSGVPGSFSATGLVTAGTNVVATANVVAGGNVVSTGYVYSGTNVSALTNITAGTFMAATANVSAGTNVTAGGNVTATSNVTAGNNVVATTAFVGPGTGLTGTAASLSIGGSAGSTANISGGAANKVLYQTGASTTGFIDAPTSGTYLYWNGSAFVWQGSTGSTTQAVTFNSTGGAIAGTSFNGSVARTIDYSTVGAPKADGTGASGTWAIGISGNAGTVSNGVYTTGSYSNPTWITSLATSKLSGQVAVANGGTGAATLTGVVYGNGTSAMTAASAAQIVAAISTTPVANATYATTSGSTPLLQTSNFSISEVGGQLVFKYGSTVILSVDSGGNVVTGGQVTAGGTP